MKIFGDEYYTIVAETKEEAEKFYVDNELGDTEDIELKEVDGSKSKVWFSIDELPEEYHDKDKYPRESICDMYIGVKITLDEAIKFKKEKPPYILSISSDLI